MRLSLLLTLLALAFTGRAQTDTLEIIAAKGCECVDKKELTGSAASIQMKLGLCILEVAKPYESFLKREYDLDMDQLAEGNGRKLGEKIGVSMAGICPEVFEKLSDSGMMDEAEGKVESEYVYGEVIKIEKLPLVVFFVKDNEGKVFRLIWLDEFEGSSGFLYSYEKLKGEKATFAFGTYSFFDSRINEYIPWRVVEGIELMPPAPELED